MTTLTLHLDYASATDPGLVRSQNEDALLAAPNVFVVADGMGGHAAGEVAAALAVEQFTPLAGRSDLTEGDVRSAIARAHQSVLTDAAADETHAGMATTATGLCLARAAAGEPVWVVFNVGDSRVYRLRADVLEQLTTDHTEVEELRAAGHLADADARNYPRRNVVTRSIGTGPAPEPDIRSLPAAAGDRFVACSDGLTSEVSDEQIATLLTEHRRPQDAADALVAAALDNGGADNVSVIVVDVRGEARDAS
jgi:protein phosphatase